MEYSNGVLSVEGFLTFTLAIMVLFVGKRVNDALD